MTFIEEIKDYNNRLATQAWDRSKLGLELRQKYEMYFVALSFTLAGLAVQSAKPASSAWMAVAEIFGWILLAVAGCLGLWRVSRMWLVLVGIVDAEPTVAGQAKVAQKQKELETLERRIRSLVVPQFIVFAVGLVLLMISRAWMIFAVGPSLSW